jgi:all-trans-retinol dehydrogenase (NAD+)
MEHLRDGLDGIKFTTVCPYFIDTGLFAGVKTHLLPILDTDYVTERIISAVLTNQTIVIIPRLLYGMLIAKSILPTNSFYRLYKMFGGNNMITKDFEGRKEMELIDTNSNFVNLKDVE